MRWKKKKQTKRNSAPLVAKCRKWYYFNVKQNENFRAVQDANRRRLPEWFFREISVFRLKRRKSDQLIGNSLIWDEMKWKDKFWLNERFWWSEQRTSILRYLTTNDDICSCHIFIPYKSFRPGCEFFRRFIVRFIAFALEICWFSSQTWQECVNDGISSGFVQQ